MSKKLNYFLFVLSSAALNQAKIRPNIILILTDDLDIAMGGMNPLNKTRNLIGDAGATFSNAFVSTPICCPSRSTILTGRYQHNTKVFNNTVAGGCNSDFWRSQLEPTSVSVAAKNNGYTTYYAGKYLNQYGSKAAGGVKHVPKGWDHWNGLVGNSRYYGYTVSRNGIPETHGNSFSADYYTDLIKNDTVKFIHEQNTTQNPLFMVVAPPAPHQPWDADPKYENMFDHITAKDYIDPKQYDVHKGDGHWLLRSAPTPMSSNSTEWADKAFRGRWATLKSVDDLVSDIFEALKETNMLDNTYLIFTSDHGYHAGQFSLPYDKRQMYDFDLRVPLLMRGPKISPKTEINTPVISVDFAPTLISLMSNEYYQISHNQYDGISFLHLLDSTQNSELDMISREDMLIEYQGEADKVLQGCEQLNGQQLAECIPEVDCMCDDAGNNTFSCVRTMKMDETDQKVLQNLVYCEFVDSENFIEVYNMIDDPSQTKNVRDTIDPQTLQNLNDKLISLSTCSGTKCSSPDPDYGYEYNVYSNDPQL